jgi:nitrogen fixation/metabolism regulation signal transduction histidine kinase
MKEMVQAFSEYARPPQIQLCPIAMEVIVNEVLDLYRGDDMSVKIHFHSEDNLPKVEADPGRLRQLLHNLIRNGLESISAQPNGQLNIHLNKIEEVGKTFVELRIDDSGPGIPSDMLDKLFEPYATTKPKGSGLGLAVVKRIVEEHAGNVFAENLATGGASLVIRLPALVQATQQPVVGDISQAEGA